MGLLSTLRNTGSYLLLTIDLQLWKRFVSFRNSWHGYTLLNRLSGCVLPVTHNTFAMYSGNQCINRFPHQATPTWLTS
ncbi:hypothetical protein CDEST_14604 [Colletotrichum destructivum]|uniref:Uncharacterized protein n=1 Tax=Colletotrichum destructivum TaxID=34406 RepID=A0AAX4J2D2_9PEZI|nr:hypothetical protein CDEST_14604 [Colletotrichum destructivum]